jgi:hypothetical protein
MPTDCEPGPGKTQATFIAWVFITTSQLTRSEMGWLQSPGPAFVVAR